MKKNRLIGIAVVVLVATMLGDTGCRRKRIDSSASTGVEQSTPEGSGASAAVPDPAATSAVPGSSDIPASHPGETQNPVAIKLAMDQFERKFQRPPNDWQEMMDAKVLAGIPKRKDGQPLEFTEFIEFYFHRGGNPGRR